MSDLTGLEEQPEQFDEGALCSRCEGQLVFLGNKRFHEGDSGFGFLLGPLRELFENREHVGMWACGECGHVEFFMRLRK
ncbi:MAG: hypothetical protein H0X39_13295 [Actinobacteria bacterium]|nr:hypothetical protein [Actinomycetota bacterium]